MKRSPKYLALYYIGYSAAAITATASWFMIPFQYAFLLTALLVWLILRLPPLTIAIIAAFLLATCAAMLLFHHEVQAEQLAVYAFFLLSMAACLTFINLLPRAPRTREARKVLARPRRRVDGIVFRNSNL